MTRFVREPDAAHVWAVHDDQGFLLGEVRRVGRRWAARPAFRPALAARFRTRRAAAQALAEGEAERTFPR